MTAASVVGQHWQIHAAGICSSRCWRLSLPRIDECLSQSVNLCTFLEDVSTHMGMSVTLFVHMYEYLCMRAAESGGDKWANGESRMKKVRS